MGGNKGKLSSDKYLYNRSHLVGYQLAGENDNWKNLFTWAEQMNQETMVQYENQVADYLRQTKNHVRYHVTPYFSKGWKNEGVGWYSLKQGDWEYGTKKVWVPKIVTVVDQPEYTTNEWAYTFGDGTQFKMTHKADTPEGQTEYEAVQDYIDQLDAEGKDNGYSTRDIYEDVVHPAITHTEDRGSYQTVIDESNIIWK